MHQTCTDLMSIAANARKQLMLTKNKMQQNLIPWLKPACILQCYNKQTLIKCTKQSSGLQRLCTDCKNSEGQEMLYLTASTKENKNKYLYGTFT